MPRPRQIGGRKRLLFEMLEDRRLLAADAGVSAAAVTAVASPWQNPTQPLDVNNDGFVSPLDALIVINKLNSDGIGALPPVDATHAPPPYYDVSGDGLLSPQDPLIVINLLNLEQGGPVLQASLKNDTAANGQTNNDLITSDPTVTGQLTAPAGQSVLTSFTVSLDSQSATQDLLATLAADGTFTLSKAQLNQMAGGTMADGVHTLHFKATDELSYVTTQDFTFTLETVAQTPGTPILDAASDSGVPGDNLTNVSSPGFDIPAEPASTVTLLVDNSAVASGPAGQVLVAPSLSDGNHKIQASIVDAAGNPSGMSSALTVNILTVAPTVNLNLLAAPISDSSPLPSVLPIEDITPNFLVAATSPDGLPNGTSFHIDVDLNNDGTFSGNELDNTVATLFNGQQSRQLAQALPTNQPVGIRARVIDSAGNVGFSAVQQVIVNTQALDTLKNFVTAPDPAYQFSLNNTIHGTGYTAYVLSLTSQNWLTPADFVGGSAAGSGYTWHHWLTIFVPSSVTSTTALLNVTGGSTTDPPPTAADFSSGSALDIIAQEAILTHSILINLPDVPQEPITFTADPTNTARSEDQIIAFTMNQFLSNPDPASTWPLLFPMVNSAVKAMDAAQSFISANVFGEQIDHFVVTGASKRGWTTWLTPAVDSRVVGIVPMVFDSLNLAYAIVHQYGVYGGFSPAILPYAQENVFGQMLTPGGLLMGKLMDPYSYLGNPNYTIPKLEINSTGDQFFVTDSSQFYIHDLPGTQNYLFEVPNSNHGLDAAQGANSLALQALVTFYNAIINNDPLPKFSWQVQDDGTIRVQTQTQPSAVKLWQATNPVARDFRLDYTDPNVVHWTSTTLTNQGNGTYLGNVPMPATGATGYYVELDFPSPLPFPYRFTTEVHVATTLPLTAWLANGPNNIVGVITGSSSPAPTLSAGDAAAGGVSAMMPSGELSATVSPLTATTLPPVAPATTPTGSPPLAGAAAVATATASDTSDDDSAALSDGTSSGSYQQPEQNADAEDVLGAALNDELDQLVSALLS